MRGIQVFPNSEQVAEAAVDLFIQAGRTAIEKRGLFSVGLSGGSSPRRLYQLLPSPGYQRQLDWQKVHFFWVDERCVAPDDDESNYRLARELLFDFIPIPSQNIHRIQGEIPRHQAAVKYENELKGFFQVDPSSPPKPTFDLLLLGVGEDGHTASLFPGSAALKAQDRWVIDVEHRTPPEPCFDRISLTLPVINASRQVVFLATGVSKAQILARILWQPGGASVLPASLVHPYSGDLVWLIDAAAASKLPEAPD